jgi:hypothetical protein
VLATAGRHVSGSSGIPVAVACPDPQVRAELASHQMGGHLMVTTSVFCAVSLMLLAPAVVVESLRLAPHPTTIRASSEFVAHTLLDWGLGPLILDANLITSELVASSMMHATADIEVSIAWSQPSLRVTIREDSPGVPRLPHAYFDLDGTWPTAVAGLSRAFGVLPTADGGKVIWAVLDSAQPKRAIRRRSSEPATSIQESTAFTDCPGLACPLLCAVDRPARKLRPSPPTPKETPSSPMRHGRPSNLTRAS